MQQSGGVRWGVSVCVPVHACAIVRWGEVCMHPESLLEMWDPPMITQRQGFSNGRMSPPQVSI